MGVSSHDHAKRATVFTVPIAHVSAGHVAGRFALAAIWTIVYAAVAVWLYVLVRHAILTYHAISAHENAVLRESVDMWENFCNAPGTQTAATARHATAVCVRAKQVIDRDIDMEIMHKVIDEHVDHVPLVHYCRHHDVCRDVVVLWLDTLRLSMFWFGIAAIVTCGAVAVLIYAGPWKQTKAALEAKHIYDRGDFERLPESSKGIDALHSDLVKRRGGV